MDPMESVQYNGFETSEDNSDDDHGSKEVVEYNGFGTSDANYHEYNEWKEVVYRRKRNQKQKPADQAANGGFSDKIGSEGNKQAEEQKQEAKMLAVDVDEEPNGTGAARDENVKREETKKPKPRRRRKKKKKKKKNTQVSLSEALAKIDSSDLEEFLVKQEPNTSQLVEFLDYFETALSQVSSVQFPWLEMFNSNCPLSKMIHVPLSHIPEPVYKASADWIDQLPDMTVSTFVKWASKNIRTDLAEEEVIIDCEKDECHETVALYVVLAMVLRRRPHSLIVLLPAMWTDISAKYRKLDEVPLTVWMMAQASQGNLSVGLHAWAHALLPLVANKKCNAQSRDYILQLVENILSNPDARTILMSGTLSEGKRLIPPYVFEGLLRLTFPASSARVKDTERFESIYPLLKQAALAGAPGSEAMKQIFTSSLKLAGEGNSVLANEATSVAIWFVAEDADCFNLWDIIYEENVEASVALLKKLLGEWTEHSLKLSSSPSDILTLKQTIKSLRIKNEKAITEGRANACLYIEADKSCKVISGRLSRGSGCLIGTAITAVLLATAGAAAAITKVSFL